METCATAVGETVAGGYNYADSSSSHSDVFASGRKVGKHYYKSDGAHVKRYT